MKSQIIVNVYILTDSQGEWWETLKTDGSTRRFRSGTAELLTDKTFPTPEKAMKYASERFQRFTVTRIDPPVAPSRVWEETVIHSVGNA
jgi:hypothetical protein